jgi:hypothetical protein
MPRHIDGAILRIAAVPEDDLAVRLRPPYRALYLAAKRAEAEARADAHSDAAKRPATPTTAHAELRDQIADLLADVEMSEEDRQRVLASLTCTCCGGSGLSLAFELKPAAKAGF